MFRARCRNRTLARDQLRFFQRLTNSRGSAVVHFSYKAHTERLIGAEDARSEADIFDPTERDAGERKARECADIRGNAYVYFFNLEDVSLVLEPAVRQWLSVERKSSMGKMGVSLRRIAYRLRRCGCRPLKQYQSPSQRCIRGVPR